MNLSYILASNFLDEINLIKLSVNAIIIKPQILYEM